MAYEPTNETIIPEVDDNYLKVLPRNEFETNRLNAQHYFFPKNLGYLIHPLLDSKLQDPFVRIADIGTGTGIFLCELGIMLPPTATLHGFDLASDQFPPPASTPGNITFSTANAMIGFPHKHRGQYDIVHLRLLSPGMTTTKDWSSVATNALTLLKPGGAIQWSEESTTEKLTVFNNVPSGDAELSSLLHFVWNIITDHYKAKDQHNPFSYFGTAVDLVSILSSAGARDLRYDVTEFARVPELRTPWTINVIEAMRGVFRCIALESASLGHHQVDVENLFERMLRLARKGKCYIRSDIHVHVAFKRDERDGEVGLEFKARL